jgi:hypothetical protein
MTRSTEGKTFGIASAASRLAPASRASTMSTFAPTIATPAR